MSNTTALLLLLACGAVTYGARSSLILLLADRTLPLAVQQALKNVGPAVLAALTVSLAVGPAGVGAVELAEAAALVAAGAMTVWKRNLMLTFAVGMSTLWIVGALT